MNRKVVFSPLSLKDISNAFEHLRAKSPRAADAFIDATEAMASVVASLPRIGKRWEHGERDLPEVRSVRIRGFNS